MLRNYYLAAASVILLGFIPAPLLTEDLFRQPADHPSVFTLLLLIIFAPVLPLIAVVVRSRTEFCLYGFLAGLLTFLVWVIGLLLTFVAVLTAGTGLIMVLLHGVALTSAVAAAPQILSREQDLDVFRSAAGYLLTAPFIVGLWSLICFGVVVFQANQISGVRPFCLAAHGSNTPVQSFAELRGLSFYSTKSGYKDTSRWYFHGVLLVQSAGGREVYNWSPRRMSFQRVRTPERLIIRPMSACKPDQNFWRTLSLFSFAR